MNYTNPTTLQSDTPLSTIDPTTTKATEHEDEDTHPTSKCLINLLTNIGLSETSSQDSVILAARRVSKATLALRTYPNPPEALREELENKAWKQVDDEDTAAGDHALAAIPTTIEGVAAKIALLGAFHDMEWDEPLVGKFTELARQLLEIADKTELSLDFTPTMPSPALADDPVIALHAKRLAGNKEYERVYSEYTACQDKEQKAALSDKADEISERESDLEGQIATTPANTIKGLQTKLHNYLRTVAEAPMINGEFVPGFPPGHRRESKPATREGKAAVSLLSDFERLVVTGQQQPVSSAVDPLLAIEAEAEKYLLAVSEDDPVAELGRSIVLTVKARNQTEDKSFGEKDTVKKFRLTETDDLLSARTAFLEESISETAATSLEGAMVQAMLVMCDAESVASWVPEDKDIKIASMRRRMGKCLYSIVEVLETHSGTSREELGSSYYMSREGSPHLLISKALSDAQRMAS